MKNKENLSHTFLIFLKLLFLKIKVLFVTIYTNSKNNSNYHSIKKSLQNKVIVIPTKVGIQDGKQNSFYKNLIYMILQRYFKNNNLFYSHASRGNPELKLFTFLNLEFDKKDLTKLFFYTCFFTFLLFYYQISNSPEETNSLNSATQLKVYDNKEVILENFQTGEKTIKKPLLSLEISPDNAKIDNTLLKSINLNLKSRYFLEKVTPLSLKIDDVRVEPRGQVIGNKLTLSGKIGKIDESLKVLVHELGHIIDLNFLQSIGDYDPSNNFYNISWASYNVKKKGSTLSDFVSGYALTNKYEDFAESFSFFVFHNEDFLERSKKNDKILQKYNFFKKYIYINKEFLGTNFEKTTISAYNWDTTKIAINLKKYLYYIK